MRIYFYNYFTTKPLLAWSSFLYCIFTIIDKYSIARLYNTIIQKLLNRIWRKKQNYKKGATSFSEICFLQSIWVFVNRKLSINLIQFKLHSKLLILPFLSAWRERERLPSYVTVGFASFFDKDILYCISIFHIFQTRLIVYFLFEQRT